MITRKSEAIVPEATVKHIFEVRSVEQAADEGGIEDPHIGQRVLHKDSTEYGITSDQDYTDDYHSGLVRHVPRYQSNLLAREKGQDSEMVWNERAVSICIAQELAKVAEVLALEGLVSRVWGNVDLELITGLDPYFLNEATHASIAEAVVAVALGANIVIDDPRLNLRELMNNGNVLGFLKEGQASGVGVPALILSSYNQPCTKPGKRLLDMFPSLVLSPLLVGSFAIQTKEVLEPYRGWLGGVFSPGVVSLGDRVFVNQALTTPPLPEET